jgi:hypothetical protein
MRSKVILNLSYKELGARITSGRLKMIRDSVGRTMMSGRQGSFGEAIAAKLVWKERAMN